MKATIALEFGNQKHRLELGVPAEQGAEPAAMPRLIP